MTPPLLPLEEVEPLPDDDVPLPEVEPLLPDEDDPLPDVDPPELLDVELLPDDVLPLEEEPEPEPPPDEDEVVPEEDPLPDDEPAPASSPKFPLLSVAVPQPAPRTIPRREATLDVRNMVFVVAMMVELPVHESCPAQRPVTVPADSMT